MKKIKIGMLALASLVMVSCGNMGQVMSAMTNTKAPVVRLQVRTCWQKPVVRSLPYRLKRKYSHIISR